MARSSRLARAEAKLRTFALSFPEAYEEFPWGDRAIKVKAKGFVFMGTSEGSFGLSVKLPVSSNAALIFPFESPTRYGLGKSGWVSVRFAPGDQIPLDWLKSWIEESYRAVAPKKLVAKLDETDRADIAVTQSAGRIPRRKKSS